MKFFTVIKLLAVYLSFEEFFLKWLPVSDQAYLLLRQLPDVVVFLLASIMLLHRFSSGRPLILAGGSIDTFLSLFVCWALITLALNPSANSFIGLANIKAMLRYIVLIYIVLSLNPSPRQIASLVRWLSWAVGVQIMIGIFQLIGGISARDFLAAREVSEGIGGLAKTFTGDRFEGVNNLMGTMGDTISFAYFLLVGLALWMFGEKSGKRRGWIMALYLTLIFLSGSKAVFITSLLMIIYFLAVNLGKKILIKRALYSLPVLILVLYAGISVEDVQQASVAFERLVEGMMNSRLGIIVYILPNLLLTPQNIIGFSPDKLYFSEYVVSAFPMVPDILLAILPKVLEDVYWVSIYVYYGAIGFVLWVGFMYATYKRIRIFKDASMPFENGVRTVSLALLLTSIPLNFLNQAFEARTYSFFLWLFCGIALVLRRRTLQGQLPK